MLFLAAVVAAIGATPNCSTSLLYCFTKRSGSTPFGDARADRYPAANGADKEAQCSAANYQAVDSCFQDPVLQFKITHPPDLAMTLLYRGNRQTPYRPEMYIDADHPLHAKELDVVAVGGPVTATDRTRRACNPSDFTDKSYAGKIVLLMRGSPCVFTDKVVNAERAGAAIALSIIDQVKNSYGMELLREAGEELSSENSSIPSGRIPATGGQQVLDHLDAGGSVRGMLVAKCTPDPMDPATIALDECPTLAESITKQVGGCADAANVTDRLCARCQGELKVGGAPKLCLRGNDLLPRKAATQFWSSRTLPAPVGETVYLVHPPEQGCAQSDYAPHAGKVVIVNRPVACSMYAAAVAARRAGVSAIVIASDGSCVDPKFCNQKYYRAQGPSGGFTLPVHAVAWESFVPFRAAAEKMPLTPSGDAHVLGTASVSVGAWTEVTPAPPVPTEYVPPRVLPEPRTDFEWSAAVVVCLLLFVLLVVLIVCMCVRDDSEREGLVQTTSFSVPLGLASTVLSVTLLVIIALTTFLLVYTAGQDSIDTAREDGRIAVSDTFQNAVTNIEELNKRWSETVTDVVHDVTYNFFMEAVRMVTMTQQTMLTYGGTWAEAERLWQPMLSVSRQSPWHLAIRTKEGFFFNKDYTTDARPDSERNDGQQHVSVTNDGRLYPNLHQFKYNKLVPYSYRVRTTDWWDPMQKVGGLYTDSFSLVEHFSPETKNPQVWFAPLYSAKLTWPTMMPVPISVIIPVFNVVTRRLVANVEAQVAATKLRDRISATLQKFPNIGNITTFVIREDGTIFSCSCDRLFSKHDRFVSDTFNAATLLLDMDSTPNVEMRAMGAYLRSDNDGKLIPSSSGQGVFDQAEYYKEVYDSRRMRFHFENGLQDSSAERYNAYVTGGAAGSMVSGGSVRFTGSEILFISNHKSVNAWNVQGTKVGSNPFRSSFRMFNHTEMIDGHEVVVAKDFKGVPLGPVLTPVLFSDDFTLSLDVLPEADVPVSDEPDLVPNFPRLFSDASGNTGIVRLFANGVLYYGIENFGCITAPIPELLPKGEWTNIMISVDFTTQHVWWVAIQGTCTVYVNGKVAAQAPLSNGVWTLAPHESYELGRNFVGRMDNLLSVNASVNAEEAAWLHRDGQYARSVPPRKWFYSYREVTVPGSPDMKLTSGILLPEEDILRSVLSNNAITRENLAVKEANTQQDLDMTTNNTAFIITVVGLASVAIFLLFNSLLTSPFAHMATLMINAALMRVDALPTVRSGITELQQMQHALRILLTNLKEYKTFLPQTLLLDEENFSCDSASELEGSVTNSSVSLKGSDSSQPSPTQRARLEVFTALLARRVTMAVLNVKGFHRMLQKADDGRVLKQHSRWAEYMLAKFTSMRGVAEPFLGDRFAASFNGAKVARGHQTAACSCLYTASLHFMADKVEVSAAAVSGDMFIGNMGCPGMRKFAFVSPTVSWMYTLERVACEQGWGVVTDAPTSQAVEDPVLLKVVGAVLFAKHSPTPLAICQIAGLSGDTEEEEWMYDTVSAKYRYAKWNEFASAVIYENWEVCVCLFLLSCLQWVITRRVAVLTRDASATTPGGSDFTPPPHEALTTLTNTGCNTACRRAARRTHRPCNRGPIRRLLGGSFRKTVPLPEVPPLGKEVQREWRKAKPPGLLDKRTPPPQ